MQPKIFKILIPIGLCIVLLVLIGGGVYAYQHYFTNGSQGVSSNIHKIKHVVIIMQENRSFDSYFGTFPGADGIKMDAKGVPIACNPDPANGGCVRPYHDKADLNAGGPHGVQSSIDVINGGKMDGFIKVAQVAKGNCTANDPACAGATVGKNKTDVMGYHDETEIPNYWAYAKNFVLQDAMFESAASWSLPSHLFMVSEWSAICSKAGDPMSCVNDLGNKPLGNLQTRNNFLNSCLKGMDSPQCKKAFDAVKITADVRAELHTLIAANCKLPPNSAFVIFNKDTIPQYSKDLSACEEKIKNFKIQDSLKTKLINATNNLKLPEYAWTDMTYLLHKNNVSWKYYVMDGSEPDCRNDEDMECASIKQNAETPSIWNPLPYFTTVNENDELDKVTSLKDFYTDARNGTLPAVSWINPAQAVSEHPPGLVSKGQGYVTGLVNSVMNGPDWDSTAIFITWDDWGGFYDHVVPPTIDQNGYGIRVPGLLISPYAKKGYIDHQTLSFDAFNKFIEDDFLNGQRLDPKTDGRPDPRPTVRDAVPQLGDLINDFDFTQTPRPPMILPGGVIY
jgi:phospholipase C